MEIKLTENQRDTLIAAHAKQLADGPYALAGDEYRNLEPKGLVTSKLAAPRRLLYTLTPRGIELAELLRDRRRNITLTSPRGGTVRTGKPATEMLRVRMDADEWAQLSAYAEAHESDRSEVVREALIMLGALKRPTKRAG